MRRQRDSDSWDDNGTETAPSRTWLIGGMVVIVVVVIVAVRLVAPLPKPLAVHAVPPTAPTVGAPASTLQGAGGLIVADDPRAAGAPVLIRTTTGYWSATAPDGPLVQPGTVLHLSARTADGQRLLATSPVWAQPLWVSAQDTDVDLAVLFALPVQADPTATPVPTETPLPPPPPTWTPVPLVCATVTDGRDLSVTRCAFNAAEAQAAADAAFNEALLAAPPRTAVPMPTLTVQPPIPAGGRP